MNTQDNSSARSHFFLTPDLGQRLDLIRHLLANTSLIPFVYSPEGAGKSRLARFLTETLQEHYVICPVNASNIGSTPDLKVLMAKTAGIAIDQAITDGILLQGLEELKKSRKNFLLLLDDVDQLAAEPLSWVLAFFTHQQVSDCANLVIFSALDLLALPLSPLDINKYRDKLQILDIPPFTGNQIKEFIAYISQTDSNLIPDERLKIIERESGGHPGKIIWQLKFAANQSQTAAKNLPVKNVSPLMVVGVISLLSVLGTVVIFQEQINQFIEQASEQKKQQELETLALQSQPKVVKVDIELPKKQDNSSENVDEPKQAIEQLQEIVIQSEQTGVALEIKRPETPLEAETKVDVEPEDQTTKEDKLQVTELALPEVSIFESEQQPTEPLNKTPEPANQQPPEAVIKEPEFVIKAPEAVTKEVEVVTKKPEVVIKQPDPKPQPVKEITMKPSDGYRTVEWLMQNQDTHYTLQLVAVSSEKAIRDYVKSHKIQGDLVILETQRNGKPWFSLLLGNYKNKNEAISARDKLPESYKAAKAWPRSIGSIRKQN